MRAERGQETPLTGRPTPAHTTGDLAGAQPNLLMGADDRTLAILEHRRQTGGMRRRGWLVRRALLLADVLGLAFAFLVAQALATGDRRRGRRSSSAEPRRCSSSRRCPPGSCSRSSTASTTATRSGPTTRRSTTSPASSTSSRVGAWLFFIGAWRDRASPTRTSRSWSLFWALAIAARHGRPRGRRARYCRATARLPAEHGHRRRRRRRAARGAQAPRSTPSTGSTCVGFVDRRRRRSAATISAPDAARARPTGCPRSIRMLDVERVDHRVLERLARADARPDPLAARTSTSRSTSCPRLFEVSARTSASTRSRGSRSSACRRSASRARRGCSSARWTSSSPRSASCARAALRSCSRCRSSSTRAARCSSARCAWAPATATFRISSSARWSRTPTSARRTSRT